MHGRGDVTELHHPIELLADQRNRVLYTVIQGSIAWSHGIGKCGDRRARECDELHVARTPRKGRGQCRSFGLERACGQGSDAFTTMASLQNLSIPRFGFDKNNSDQLITRIEGVRVLG